MPKRSRRSQLVRKEVWDLGGKQIAVFIHVEHRPGARAAFGVKGLNVRLPYGLSAEDIQKSLLHFKTWAQKELQNRAALQERYSQADYQDGDTLRVGQFNYRLKIEVSDSGRHYGSIKDNQIHLRLAPKDSALNRSKAIKHLLSRLVAKHQLGRIQVRVNELNAQSYQVPIKDIKLKYMSTRWGSCSSSGNINLSTRLLFAPQEVIDYVIIHELAHRLEMNHSPKFWAHVARVVPNYKQYEKWLKTYGKDCDF